MYIAFLNTPFKKPKDPWIFLSIPFYVEIPIIHNRGLSVSTVTVLVSLLSNVLDVLIKSPNRKAPLSMKTKCIKHAPVCLDEKMGILSRFLTFYSTLKITIVVKYSNDYIRIAFILREGSNSKSISNLVLNQSINSCK